MTEVCCGERVEVNVSQHGEGGQSQAIYSLLIIGALRHWAVLSLGPPLSVRYRHFRQSH